MTDRLITYAQGEAIIAALTRIAVALEPTSEPEPEPESIPEPEPEPTEGGE